MFVYLARLEPSGDAVFTRRDDARDWLDNQFRYHYPELTLTGWTTSEHGWDQQQWTGTPDDGQQVHAGVVRLMQVDRELPDWRKDTDD